MLATYLRFHKYTALLALWLLVCIPAAYAQPSGGYGIIFGEIRDKTTGESLPGANVILSGSTVGVATDADGRYTLRRVPVGEVTVEFRFLGYITSERTVQLEEDQRLEVNVELESDFIEGDEIYVTARQRGQARALTAQRQAASIRTVVSSEQIDRFADVTVEGALQRIAGMGHGGSNIRGVGAGMARVTMDGQRMGSTEADRSVDLGTISADMVGQLEVIKVITPDMSADALAGVININTRRSIGGERTMNVRAGGGWNSRFVDHVGPTGRLSFSYGDSPRSNFSYGINASYQRDIPATESVRTDWGWRNFSQIEGISSVLTGLRSGISFDPRDRYAVGTQFTLQPTERSTFHVMTNFNYQHRAREQHLMSWGIGHHISPWETYRHESPGRSGHLRYIASLDEQHIYQYTAQFGGRHLFDRFDMEYKMGWGHGRTNRNQYEALFHSGTRIDFFINYDKGNREPILDFKPTGLLRQYPTRAQFSGDEPKEQRYSFHKNNDLTATIDFNVPLSLGSFKFGSSAMATFSDGFDENFELTYQRDLFLRDYDEYMGRRDFYVFDRQHHTYHLPYIIDVYRLREWNRTYRPHFDMDREEWALTSETEFYNAYEYTVGSYGMATIDIWRFRLLGGLRMEYTDTRYEGRAGSIDAEGRFRGAVDTLSTNNYTFVFPNAQVVFALGRLTNIRMAYSRSIGRPTMNQLSASILWNYNSERITQGNPELQPMISDNLDFLFEHYFMNIGQFTIGLFYKDMKDFVYRYTELIGPAGVDGEGTYAMWRRTTFRNGEQAKVYGIELSWQQNLDFLPGFLGNFGTYTNYAYAYSEADVDRPGQTARLAGQRPHVVNAGLDYTQGRFSSQLSYAWGSPSITEYGDLDFIPDLYGDTKRVYMDRYRDAANDLSLTVRYRISQDFRIWADASNILNHRSISYVYDQSVYPETQLLAGRTVSLGLHYSF